MRLSRPDENDPAKRRHFEISIDSPFTILSCRATQANMSLPAYSSGGQAPIPSAEFECGCPGAALRRRNTPTTPRELVSAVSNPLESNGSTPTMPTPHRSWTSDDAGLTRPTQAHLHDDPNSGSPRPIHLLRTPSFNPPAFDEDEPPPPLVTPPPNYEHIVSGDSTSALADYFARLADEMGEE